MAWVLEWILSLFFAIVKPARRPASFTIRIGPVTNVKEDDMPSQLAATLPVGGPADKIIVQVLDTTGNVIPTLAGITYVPTDANVVAAAAPDATGMTDVISVGPSGTVGESTPVTVTVPGLPPQVITVSIGAGAPTGVPASFTVSVAPVS